MKSIRIYDSTLCCANRMSFKEKLETARLLDDIRVDIIEMPHLNGDKADELLVKTIASLAKNSGISCPVGMREGEVARAWAAVSGAKKPRIDVKLPVSSVQMEYMCKTKPADMLKAISNTVAEAKSVCNNVSFTALDATRAEAEFLAQAIKCALDAGATSIIVSDDAGTSLPDEFGSFIKSLYISVPELHEYTVGVCCGDALNMASACAIQAARAGAGEITVRAFGEGVPSLKAIMEILNARGDALGAACGVDSTFVKRAAARIARFGHAESQENEKGADMPTNAKRLSELNKNSDINDVSRAARLLGYDLSDEDKARVFEAFMQLASKKNVGSQELDAIIASVALQVPPTFSLESYVVNSGNIISATAHIKLHKNGVPIQGLSTGDGPIDAALMAIEKIIGHHYELDDFQIQSVTSGREAMGEALVKLRDGGRLYSGRGISTDIIGAAIRAYLNALNKIVYRETE